jgi:3-hydroxybutyryl-CoA dehydrogenase
MIKNIGIAGAGTMGATIAQIFAQEGYKVVLYDVDDRSIARGKDIILLNQLTMVKEGLISKEVEQISLNNITFTLDINELAKADLIIEAIVEKIEIKQRFWEKVSNLAKEDAILATNTSGLSITEVGEYVKNKGRFIGMHWWNPPHLIPLIEIIKGNESNDETAQVLIDISNKLNKKPILVRKDVLGFVGNRLQYALLREALHIIEEEIATAEDVDDAMKYGLGLRYSGLGPIETVDLGGVDIFNNVGSYLFGALCNDKDVPKKLRELYEHNNLGIKTGKGFFDYSNGRLEEILKRRDTHFINMLKHVYKD